MRKFIIAFVISASFTANAGVEKLGSWITKSEINKMTDQTEPPRVSWRVFYL
ncbi:hypothetical protein ESSG_01066 [Escherichia coli H730]|nr:hypothetical protein ESSG_01066 [Escherichia coli H730]GDA39906.1 hypothetical protein HmCmsJML138_03421 [Escherichia coli]